MLDPKHATRHKKQQELTYQNSIGACSNLIESSSLSFTLHMGCTICKSVVVENQQRSTETNGLISSNDCYHVQLVDVNCIGTFLVLLCFHSTWARVRGNGQIVITQIADIQVVDETACRNEIILRMQHGVWKAKTIHCPPSSPRITIWPASRAARRQLVIGAKTLGEHLVARKLAKSTNTSSNHVQHAMQTIAFVSEARSTLWRTVTF